MPDDPSNPTGTSAQAVALGSFGVVRKVELLSTGGTSTPLLPFQLVNASDGGGAKVRVVSSTINGILPSGFSAGDSPPYILDVDATSVIYACATFTTGDSINYAPLSASLGIGASVPDDDNATGTFYFRIGSVTLSGSSLTVTNDCYGPLSALCYRDWFHDSQDPYILVFWGGFFAFAQGQT